MEDRRRRWPAVVAVLAVVVVGFLALTGMSYARWGTPLGWMGGCHAYYGGYRAVGTQEGVAVSDVGRIASGYVASYGSADLAIAEIMEFDNHYYVEVMEESTGRYAFEFLIDRATGRATPEPGPNMMWNLKYGHMRGGMMGRFTYPSNVEAPMPVSEEEARAAAQAYLARTGLRLDVDEHAAAFYGYYTLHTLRDGQIVGMLSVNGYTGEIWPHTWHGKYLGSFEIEDH